MEELAANLSLYIDQNGRRLQRDCNVFGEPVYEKATDAEGKNPSISTWRYDSLGRVTRAVRDGHSYEYVYDEQGNLKEKRSSGRRLISYTYDKMGQVTEIKDLAGVCTRYKYDVIGRRIRIYNEDGLEVRYGYDALNCISHILYGNDVESLCLELLENGKRTGFGYHSGELLHKKVRVYEQYSSSQYS